MRAVSLYILFLFAGTAAFSQAPCDSSWIPNASKKNFRLKNEFTLREASFLKTDGIYISEVALQTSEKNARTDRPAVYSFYWFFAGGRVFKSLPYCQAFNLDNIDFRYGWKGYYKIENTKIYIEFYSDSYSGYVTENGIIENDNIRIISYKPRGWFTSTFKLPQPMVFTFQAANTKKSPSW
jgi:hypothetical protein